MTGCMYPKEYVYTHVPLLAIAEGSHAAHLKERAECFAGNYISARDRRNEIRNKPTLQYYDVAASCQSHLEATGGVPWLCRRSTQ